jgi:hypothetical protein
MINDLNTSSISNTSHGLSDWFAVIEFLAGISMNPDSTGDVTITRKKGSDWSVHVDISDTDSKHKKRSRTRSGVGIYDLYW